MGATGLGGNWEIPMGSVVYTADGRKLGQVTRGDAFGLRVEDGFLFRCVYHVMLSDVGRYEEGDLLLKLTFEQVEERQR